MTKKMVEVTQDEYHDAVNALRDQDDFGSGYDVGRTHGMGTDYVGNKVIGEWNWVLVGVKRLWTFKLLKEVNE